MTRPGCIVFLVDESAAMGVPAVQSSKKKAENVATALNALLNRLTRGPTIELSIVGYRGDAAGQVDVAPRWQGALAGQRFVRSDELAGRETSVARRRRRSPAGDGTQDEEIDFPIWYEPQLGEKAPQVAAFDFCHQLLSDWASASVPASGAPLVVHISGGASGDGNPQQAVRRLLEMKLLGGAPLVLQVHLTSTAAVPPTLFPSNKAYLPLGPARDTFDRCSELPAAWREALIAAGLPVNEQARGMIYNGQMVDLARLLSIIEQPLLPAEGVASAPSATPPALPPPCPSIPAGGPTSTGSDTVPSAVPPPASPEVTVVPGSVKASRECPALIALVLDRSVQDPYGGDLKNACVRLQEHVNDLLGNIAQRCGGTVEVMLLSYGAGSDGATEVRNAFDGALSGRVSVRGDELQSGALRVDEYEEEVYDGVSNVMMIPRRRYILLATEPTAAAPAEPAFRQLAEQIRTWCADHASCPLPPIVLHLTRGALDPVDVQAALSHLQAALSDPQAPSSAGAVVVYHLAVTESPHPAIPYPDSDEPLELAGLKALWQATSPLLGREELRKTILYVAHESRGFVVNGKFDLLLEVFPASCPA